MWVATLLTWLASVLVVPPEGPYPQVIPYPVFSAALNAFGPTEVDMALCIAREESNYGRNTRPGAEGEIGVWQIHPIHGIPAAALLEPTVNAAAAKMLRDRAGDWSPWRHAWNTCRGR